MSPIDATVPYVSGTTAGTAAVVTPTLTTSANTNSR